MLYESWAIGMLDQATDLSHSELAMVLQAVAGPRVEYRWHLAMRIPPAAVHPCDALHYTTRADHCLVHHLAWHSPPTGIAVSLCSGSQGTHRKCASHN